MKCGHWTRWTRHFSVFPNTRISTRRLIKWSLGAPSLEGGTYALIWWLSWECSIVRYFLGFKIGLKWILISQQFCAFSSTTMYSWSLPLTHIILHPAYVIKVNPGEVFVFTNFFFFINKNFLTRYIIIVLIDVFLRFSMSLLLFFVFFLILFVIFVIFVICSWI